jgi:hypothetical protein
MHTIVVKGILDVRAGIWDAIESLKIRIVIGEKQGSGTFTIQSIVAQDWMTGLDAEKRVRWRAGR